MQVPLNETDAAAPLPSPGDGSRELLEKSFDNFPEMRYNGPATRSDSRGGRPKGPP